MLGVAFLTVIWLILSDNFTIVNIIAGVAVSWLALHFARKLLLLPKLPNINYGKFALYPFYLLFQVYNSSLLVMKIIFKGGRTDIVEVDTLIDNEFLITILGNSITLTPGTILLDQKDSKLTILWLREKNASLPENVSDEVKGKLEGKLLKIRK